MTEQPSYHIGIRNNLLTAEHRRRLGMRVYEYMWLVDHVTEEYRTPEGEIRGRVHGGAPIKAEVIAATWEVSLDTVRDSLEKLALAGYITRVRVGRGYLVEVRNSCKWPNRFSGPDTSGPSSTGSPTGGPPELPTDLPTGTGDLSPPSTGDGAYQQNPQPSTDQETRNITPLSTPPAQETGSCPQSGSPDSESRRVGGSPDSPNALQSESPTPKDIAMEIDTASGNESIAPAAEEAPAGEAERLWSIAVGVAARGKSGRYRQALEKAKPIGIVASCLEVAFPTDDADRRLVQALDGVLRNALCLIGGQIELLRFIEPNHEARAGP